MDVSKRITILIFFINNFIKKDKDQQKTLQRYLRHFSCMHGTVSSAGPNSLQSFPPFDAGGLVQVRVRVFIPSPHVTLHSDSDHSVYPPSTTTKERIIHTK